MHGTLVFVHGTGVRQEGWDKLYACVQKLSLENGIDGVKFVGCPWGLSLGVPLTHIPATLPLEVSTKAIADLAPASLGMATWSLLLEDPLFELRLIGEGASELEVGQDQVVVGEERFDQEVVAMLQGLRSEMGALDLGETGITGQELANAAEFVAGTEALLNAAQAVQKATPDFVEALARAVVAQVLAAHRFDAPGTAPRALLDGTKRDRLVEQVGNALAPVVLKGAITDWVRKKVSGFAARKATSFLEHRRQGLMGMSTPAIGDILFYQRRGEAMREFVASRLGGDLERPVVAVGHSLGGIMLVDLLSRPGAPKVDLLVTAGSQSPMLYAIDALDSIRLGRTPPAPFTPWLNIYNRQDLLSFVAGRIFREVDGITDEEVDPEVPFPESHSAYWTHAPVYKLIRKHWPDVP